MTITKTDFAYIQWLKLFMKAVGRESGNDLYRRLSYRKLSPINTPYVSMTVANRNLYVIGHAPPNLVTA